MSKKKQSHGRYITLANSTTLFAIAISWVSVYALLYLADAGLAFVLLLVAFIIDCFDGFIARKTNTVSSFGRFLDSNGDILIYVVVPSLIFLVHFGAVDIISIFVQIMFISAGLFRLARYNDIGYVGNATISYPGIPVVFSHLILYIFFYFSLSSLVFLNFLLITLSTLMVSSISFPKPKTIHVVMIIIGALIALTIKFYNL